MNVWKFQSPSGDRWELVESEVGFFGVSTVGGVTASVQLKKWEVMRWMTEATGAAWLNRPKKPISKPPAIETEVESSWDSTGHRRRRQRVNWREPEHPRKGLFMGRSPTLDER